MLFVIYVIAGVFLALSFTMLAVQYLVFDCLAVQLFSDVP